MHKQTIIDFKELGLRQLFTKPLKELKTRDLDQVETLLREVEAYQEAGFYAVGYVSYEAAPAGGTPSIFLWPLGSFRLDGRK